MKLTRANRAGLIEAIRMVGALEWGWPIHETDRVRNMVDA